MRPLALLALAAVTLYGQPASDAAKLADAEKLKEEIEQGTPITSDLVRNACGACHKSDDKLRMSRISYRRTTPEGWERTIKRMASLNNVHLEPAQARDILKYLSNNLGLAPEEVKPGAFEVENRMIEYKYAADKDTEQTCTKCHSFGRVLLQRRTKTEWELLIAMHRGYYPLSDFQAFRRMSPIQTQPGPDGRPPDNRHPMEKAITHLSTAFPLKTPEWSAWSANMRTPKLAGRWAVLAYQPGKGPLCGVVDIKQSPQAEDEFITQAHLLYARSGQKLERSGKALVYTGFEWRGRSESTREVMFVDRNMREITGRWFSGAYDELGTDVKLERIGNDPVVLGLNRTALKTGATVAIDIHGINFPANVAASAIDFGHGIKVGRVLSATRELLKVEVVVDKNAPIGARDVFVAGAALPASAVVYDKIDAIKVMPQAGMARIGGINFPKQYQQFEAIAFSNGPDGKPDTKDDLNLGPVDVAWSIEEYTATFGDDDKDYVGTLDDNGLFTPNVDGPNPKRRNHADNYGDVWVVATYSKESKPVRGRAHLLVTVPLYMRWDMPQAAP